MKFKCLDTCGGKCCTLNWDGRAGFVFLTKEDRERISKFLGVGDLEFASRGAFHFTRFSGKPTNQWFLNQSKNKTCGFLIEGKCSIYEARPTQCRTFPFWPENIMTMSSLKEVCPGIGEGENQDPKIVLEQIRADKELCNQTK